MKVNKVKNQKKTNLEDHDDYLERNLKKFNLPKNLKAETSNKIKTIDSDHEDYKNTKEEEYQGGVGLTGEVKVVFSKKNIKGWMEYSKKFKVCRCFAPIECSILEPKRKGN